MDKERSIHEAFIKGNTSNERDKTALNNEFVYAIRYQHDKAQYSYYTKTLNGAINCKAILAAMDTSSEIVKL